MVRGLAPSAMRIPISRVRSETRYDSTPKMPTAARHTDVSANDDSRNVRNRGSAADCSTSAETGCSSMTGVFASTWRNCDRIRVAAAASSMSLRTTK